MRTRIQATVDPGLWRDRDPNYPGVPQPASDVVTRATSRATVDYETYVIRYTSLQRLNVLLLVIGVVGLIGAAVYLSGPVLIIGGALAIGLILAGGAGFITAADAHRTYTQYLAVSVSETYERPAPRPQPETVRPFVASANGNGRTTNTGRLDFTPQVWQSLFNRALANGGVINRDDVAKRAGIGRQWYYGEGYGQLLGELTRLDFIDARRRLTPAALAWYEAQIALPLDAIPLRPRSARTDGRTDGAHGLDLTLVGEGE